MDRVPSKPRPNGGTDAGSNRKRASSRGTNGQSQDKNAGSKQFLSLVPRIDAAGVSKADRMRNVKRAIEEAIRNSNAELLRKKPETTPIGGKTHRDVVAERQQQSHVCRHWAAVIQDAVHDGIDLGLPDALLNSGVERILELEEEAAEEEAAAKLAHEARVAIASASIKTPFTKPGSKAALRAAAAQRVPLGEGTIVQLKGLEGVTAITLGAIDVSLEKYDGRKGRVSQDPPPWVIKAVGSKAGEKADAPDARHEELGGLVPILLDSRSTDKHRHRGVWIAVPPRYLKVLSSV